MTVDDFGVLQAVLDAEAARGNAASVDVAGAAGRGDAPVAQLAGVLDRGAVEVDFELGPLVAWSPRSPREWDLVDTVTGATVRSGSPGPLTWLRRHVAADVVEPRRRLGWLADDPRLGPGLTERRARVHVSGSAVEAFTRIDRLLAALDDVDGVLPEWFVELFARSGTGRAGRRTSASAAVSTTPNSNGRRGRPAGPRPRGGGRSRRPNAPGGGSTPRSCTSTRSTWSST